jgi:deoxyribodipyrimidine photo-lyase
MDSAEKINIFWFRRDLRLDDNTALNAALSAGLPVLPLFIFDRNITDDLRNDDPRITFIYDALASINKKLAQYGSGILALKGYPEKILKDLVSVYNIDKIFYNRDYEPYALDRDNKLTGILKKRGTLTESFKDQVIFEQKEVVKPDGSPYTMFTPYKKAWLKKFITLEMQPHGMRGNNFLKHDIRFQELTDVGFRNSSILVRPYDLSCIREYDRYRDFPSEDRTTHLGPHLRFGTASIRKIAALAAKENPVFLGELIWREFFMQILFNFPHVVTGNFRTKYDNVGWRNNEDEFRRWCNGETGYPIVDAGMRQLNETGFMHNRVRMITAGFLCKHLLTAWWYGEAYFAGKLLDYELSSNNGNWQWVAGTGCDAAQYFRVFNPVYQQKKFDPHDEYVKQWVPDYNKSNYPRQIVEHSFARERAIEAYRTGIR